jgi:hypothetical protein
LENKENGMYLKEVDYWVDGDPEITELNTSACLAK